MGASVSGVVLKCIAKVCFCLCLCANMLHLHLLLHVRSNELMQLSGASSKSCTLIVRDRSSACSSAQQQGTHMYYVPLCCMSITRRLLAAWVNMYATLAGCVSNPSKKLHWFHLMPTPLHQQHVRAGRCPAAHRFSRGPVQNALFIQDRMWSRGSGASSYSKGSWCKGSAVQSPGQSSIRAGPTAPLLLLLLFESHVRSPGFRISQLQLGKNVPSLCKITPHGFAHDYEII